MKDIKLQAKTVIHNDTYSLNRLTERHFRKCLKKCFIYGLKLRSNTILY